MKVYSSPSAQSVTLAMLSAISLMRLSRGFTSITVRQSVSSASAVFAGRNFSQSSKPLFMSTDTELATDSKTKISFPKRVKTVDVQDASDETISIKGWVRTVRKQKTLAFVEVNDGSSLSGIQCVLSFDVIDENSKKDIGRLSTGASVEIHGKIVESQGGKQKVEVSGSFMRIVGECSGDTYPLAKKRHSLEYLRSIAHLRTRTNTLSAVARVRSTLAGAIHQFFQSQGFFVCPNSPHNSQ